ncbi:MAG: RagB/SusD family nutrient uptake outer membrane protein [Porphyromonadaceae bacterium]|nr:MAG: RagB/SusD family nutrient uptake outer membrane protein [Porphyromonadaceae bacterium]
MKRIVYLISLGLSSLVLNSCEDFLDKEVDINLTEDKIFSDVHYAPGFLNNIYNDLLTGFNRYDGAMLACGCDEAKNSYSGSLVQIFNNGAVNSSLNPDEIWDKMYGGIRKTNIFLEKLNTTIKETNSIPEKDRPRMKGEAFFLRAMFHFELVKRYGRIPYVDKVLTVENAGNVPQITFDEMVERIVNDCDTSFVYLSESNDDANKGRAVKASAMALKSRILLYAASPLNNTGNDLSKWDRAAQAALLLLNMRGATIGLESKYEYVFNTPFSKEVLLATQPVNTNEFEKANFPLSYGGTGLTNPTQNLVDAFDTKWGKPITEDLNYNSSKPYENRDDRFYSVILYNGAVFKSRQVETYIGGKDGLLSASTATKTGYYLKKFVDSSVDLDKGTTVRKPWIIFRFAEAYLNYAEALNEAAGPVQQVYDAVYELRKRNYVITSRARYPAGLSQSQMRERLKKERQVELAFEEHRFWDLRRWKDAEDILNKPAMGMRITLNQADTTFSYQNFEVENRIFNSRFYWYPIPRKEVLKGYVKQNPGWE